MDNTAIQQIQLSEATRAINEALENGLVRDGSPVAALHKNFELVDLEGHLPHRTRYRGRMTTSIIDDFVKYVKDHQQAGSVCFINPDKMNAKAIFNLGDKELPGHADFTAELKLDMTAEYRSLLQKNGQAQSQQDFAEWAEDWREFITFHDEKMETVESSRAIAGIRRMTIQQTRKEDHEVGNFHASRSALESIEAKSEHGIPASFTFVCTPYNSLGEHTFTCRISTLKGGDAPRFTYRIVQMEYQAELISESFLEILQDRFVETDLEIYRGEFSA